MTAPCHKSRQIRRMNPPNARMKHTIIVCSAFRHSSVATKSVGDAIVLIPKQEMIAPNCFLAHIYPLHQISFIVNMVSTRLFFPQSRTVSPLSCYISTSGLNFFLTSPMKHVFAHAYTHRHHPRHVTSLWFPDKHVPPQSTLVFPFPKITSANYSFSHIYTIVQLLFTKAAVHIASWYSTSVIVAYRQTDASQPWSKMPPQLFEAMLLLCVWDQRHHT